MKLSPPTFHGDRREWNAYAKGGWIVLFLWQGSKFTTGEVARLTRTTDRNARRLMSSLSADFPIVNVEGKWQWMERN